MIQFRLQKKSSGKNLTYYIIVQNKYNHITKGFIEKVGTYLPHPDH